MPRHRLAAISTLVLVLLCGFEWSAPLGRYLRDLDAPEPAVRAAAVRRIADLPAHEVEPVILRALEDDAPEVRIEAAHAAARLHLAAARPILLGWAEDLDDDVRQEALRALGSIGGDGVVAVLSRALSDARATVRVAALEALLTLGDPAGAPAAARALDDADAGVRALAARTLGALGASDAEAALSVRASDEAPEVRAAVLAALARTESAGAAPLLVAALDDDVVEVRLGAIVALGEARADVAAAALEPLTRDPDTRIARAAVASLAQLEGETALSAVVEAALGDAAGATAETALRARARRAPDATALAVAQRLGRDGPAATRAAEVLSAIAAGASIQAAVPALLEAWATRRGGLAVLRALGASGASDALLSLLVALASEVAEERVAATEAIALYFDAAGPDGRAVEPLLEALATAADGERLPLVDLLGRIGAPRAAAGLVGMTGSADSTLVSRIARALGAMDHDDARAALARLLVHSDGRVRAEAARALGRVGGEGEIEGLLDLLEDEAPTDRHAALEALGALGARLGRAGAAPPALVLRIAARATDEDPRLADAAVLALARLSDAAACAALRELLGTVSISREMTVLRALGACEDEVSRVVLRERLSSPSPNLAAAAAGALGERGAAADGVLLLEVFGTLAWPASAAASFSIARLARRGLLAEDAVPAVCALGAEAHDPVIRANVAATLAALGRRCDAGPDPDAWLDRPRSAPVRAAAARWLWATRELDGRGLAVEAALSECASDLASATVARACEAPELPALGSRADVVAYAPDGRTLLAERWVALGLFDGTVLLARTDANARLVVEGAPEGPLWIEVPDNLPLEP